RELALAGADVTVLERDNIVGGISRTEEHNGFRFDVGPHRFFTKIAEVDRIWHEILGEDFFTVDRLTRIRFRGQLMDYPLSIGSTLSALGVGDSVMAMLSYAWSRVHKVPEDSFEGWVTNRFGRRLYEHFFKTYSEKVWGMPCTELSADWAAQRIKSLSLMKAVRDALLQSGSSEATSLVRQFNYPKFGAGMLYERYQQQIEQDGGQVLLGHEVVGINRSGNRIESVSVHTPSGEATIEADHFISTMPLDNLMLSISPAAPAEAVEGARNLRHRSLIAVDLIVDEPAPFPDQWIYVHDSEVQVGRIQCYVNWSPHMVPEEATCGIGMEYFAWTSDPIWTMEDDAIVEMAAAELEKLGLAPAESVREGFSIRVPDAYPVYDPGYRERVATIRKWLDGIENLQTIGRGGQHRYNNMDHSVLTGMLAARNILGEDNDVWAVNTEEDYLERK
ncbi:MAG: NAD(P)/FAD-dependent oxidoreductase, partial [Armatimonadota bacterium]